MKGYWVFYTAMSLKELEKMNEAAYLIFPNCEGAEELWESLKDKMRKSIIRYKPNPYEKMVVYVQLPDDVHSPFENAAKEKEQLSSIELT